MDLRDLTWLALSYAFLSSVLLTFELLWRRRGGSWFVAVSALGVLGVVAFLTAQVGPGLGRFVQSLGDRGIRDWLAVGIGAALAGGWAARLLTPVTPGPVLFSGRERLRRAVQSLVIAGSVAGGAGGLAVFIYKELHPLPPRETCRPTDPRFVSWEIGKIGAAPVRIALDGAGGVLVSHFTTDANMVYGGGITRLSRAPAGGRWEAKVIARSKVLYRTLGLVERDGVIYVSRSGHHAVAREGRIDFVSCGAITALKDMNGDGYYEYYDDIIAGLPGARGPDTMHQNNGLAFDLQGRLLICSGANADRSLDAHPWAGAVLRADLASREVEVYARGFRNPFGITCTPAGDVFATDNDVEENPGDEVNHILQGEHYGHPLVLPNDGRVTAVGFEAPIFLGQGASNLTGIVSTEAAAESLPSDYRDCLLVSDFTTDRILRLKLQRSGERFKVMETTVFAHVPSPVDLAIAPDGSVFVLSRYMQRVYVVHPRNQMAGGAG